MNVYERVGEPGRDGRLPACPLSQAARLEEEPTAHHQPPFRHQRMPTGAP